MTACACGFAVRDLEARSQTDLAHSPAYALGRLEVAAQRLLDILDQGGDVAIATALLRDALAAARTPFEARS